MQLQRTIVITLLGLFCLLAKHASAQKGTPEKRPTNATVNTHFPQHEEFKEEMLGRLSVPNDFKVQLVASGLGKPRMLVADKERLYITRRDQGDVLMLSGTGADNKFTELKTVVSQFNGVHGIAIHEGWMYLISNRELKRAKIRPDGMLDEPVLLLSDLPDGGQHPNRTLSFGPDGKLYITVGSTCNDCGESNAENATILRVNADGTERMIFARGLRNTIGIDWQPATKELWGADNGTDWRGDDMPHEEINKIVEGGDYGWPTVFEDQKVDYTREDPIGSTKDAYAKTTKPSLYLLPAHSAPINFVFLDKVKSLPAAYRGDALVSLHGSWNRAQPEGYKIVRIRFRNNMVTGAEDFLTGFLNKETNTRFGRPAGMVVTEKGIFFSDDENGNIYLISLK